MRRIACFLAILTVVATASIARADDDRAASVESQSTREQSVTHPQPERQRPDPAACATLCRVFEFLGALERPSPPKPIPTS